MKGSKPNLTIADDPEYKAIKLETHKQFLRNIMQGYNPTEAYLRAFPNATNRKKAGQSAYKLKERYADLLNRNLPLDQVAIARVANRTLQNLENMAFADVGELLDADGKPLPLKQVPPHIRMAISKIKIGPEGVEYELAGKVKSLEVLSRVARIDGKNTNINIAHINVEDRDARLAEILVRAQAREQRSLKEEDDSKK